MIINLRIKPTHRKQMKEYSKIVISVSSRCYFDLEEAICRFVTELVHFKVLKALNYLSILI